MDNLAGCVQGLEEGFLSHTKMEDSRAWGNFDIISGFGCLLELAGERKRPREDDAARLYGHAGPVVESLIVLSFFITPYSSSHSVS